MATYKGTGYDTSTGNNRTGLAADVISFDTNMAVAGNLDVTGNIISRDEERVLVHDNFLDINFGYTTVAGLAGGVAVNYLPITGGRTINSTSANITFAAASGATRPTLSVAQAQLPDGTFVANDIIQIAGTTNAENDGFYVVQGLTNADPAVLSILSTAISSPDTVNFKPAQINFTGETESASTSVTLTKVNVNVLQTSAAGAWQTQNGSADGTFASYTPLGTSTLQQAYDAGNTITTDATGAITFTLSSDNQGLSVEGSSGGNGDVSFGGGTAVSSFKIGSSGGASSWVSTGQNLSFSTVTSGEVDITSAAALDLNGVAVTIDGSAGVSVDGSGAASNFSSTAQALSIKTITSGALDVTSAGTLACTGAGASTFGDDVAVWSFDGAGAVTETGMTSIAVTPTAAITLTGGAASTYTTSAGALTLTGAAASTWSTGAGQLTITGAAELELNGVGVDVNSTSVLRMDSTDASNFTMVADSASSKTLTVSGTNSGGGTGIVAITGGDKVLNTVGSNTTDLRGDRFDVTSTDRIRMESVSDSHYKMSQTANTASTLQITANQTGSQAADATLKLAATTNGAGDAIVDIDGKNVHIDATAAVSIDAGAASNFTTGAGALTLLGAAGVTVTSTGGTLTLDGTGQTVDLNSTALDIDAAGAITVDAAANQNITIAGAVGSGDVRLRGPSVSMEAYFTANETLVAGDIVYLLDNSGLRAGKTDADAAATSQFCGVVITGVAGGSDTPVAVAGVVDGVTSNIGFTAATHTGKKVYLSTDAGKITPTAPTASGKTIFQVGIALSGSGTDWKVLLQPQFIMLIG